MNSNFPDLQVSLLPTVNKIISKLLQQDERGNNSSDGWWTRSRGRSNNIFIILNRERKEQYIHKGQENYKRWFLQVLLQHRRNNPLPMKQL